MAKNLKSNYVKYNTNKSTANQRVQYEKISPFGVTVLNLQKTNVLNYPESIILLLGIY